MSNNAYQQYGGNPYEGSGQAEAGYGQASPYGGQGGYGASNPYGASVSTYAAGHCIWP